MCEADCARPGLGEAGELPGCEEYREPDPSLQAVVSLASGGGVGVGDSLEMVDTDLVMRTARY